jgi:glutaminyl-peptide cyclotransferase
MTHRTPRRLALTLAAALLIALPAALAACRSAGTTSVPSAGEGASVPVYGYEVVNVYPHDPHAFTQGLVYDGGVLYESTGEYGQSSLRKVELQTGKVMQRRDVAEEYFAEGLALFEGRLFQLTWQAGKGFIYDRETFAPQGEFSYAGEGWGLTHDGSSLVLSDGTNQLRFLDPATFRVRRAVNVYDRGERVEQLNELEYVNGEIFANVWQADRVARIEPQSGRVVGWVDFAGLLPDQDRLPATDVLNGIAYDAAQDRLFVTGKNWPKLFEVRLKKKR